VGHQGGTNICQKYIVGEPMYSLCIGSLLGAHLEKIIPGKANTLLLIMPRKSYNYHLIIYFEGSPLG